MFWLPTFPHEVILCSIFKPNNTFFMIPTWSAWLALLLTSPVYFLVHTYLELIIPDAYGITKPCCFCFMKAPKQEAMTIEAPDISPFDDEEKQEQLLER